MKGRKPKREEKATPPGEKKMCSTCGEIKSLGCFSPNKHTLDGRYYECKSCGSKYRNMRRAVNPEKEREREKQWRLNNPEACARKRAKQRERYWANREREIERAKEWQQKNKRSRAETKRQWNRDNREKVHLMTMRANKKLRGTAKGSLNHRISTYMQRMLRGKKEMKSWRTLVDFSLEQLMEHLEKHFLPGMSWENRGQWHIDHVIPVSAFNFSSPTDIDFKRCWSLENLRPMWAADNIRKSNKISMPFQPSLQIGIEP